MNDPNRFDKLIARLNEAFLSQKTLNRKALHDLVDLEFPDSEENDYGHWWVAAV